MTDKPKGYRVIKLWDDGGGQHEQVLLRLPDGSFDFVYEFGGNGHIFASVIEAQRVAHINTNVQTMLIKRGVFKSRYKSEYFVSPVYKKETITRQRMLCSSTKEMLRKRKKRQKSLRANITGYPRRKTILKG